MLLKTNHGGVHHQRLMAVVANELLRKGYRITVAGNRKGRYKFFPTVDIIAENQSEILLVECGWLPELSRIRDLKRFAEEYKRKKIRIIWVPYIHSLVPQKSALESE